MKHAATLVGLCVALVGPPTVAAVTLRTFGELDPARANLLGQIGLWILALALVGIILLWERLNLSSVGLARPQPQTLILGVGAAALLIYVATPIAVWLIALLALPGSESGVSRLLGIPLNALVFAALTAGVVEELLYRGYAIERLSLLLGRRWLGALLALVAFALAHAPFWGAGWVVATFLVGGVLTLLYLWKRDLVANMMAHALTGVVQLVGVAGPHGG